MELFFLGGSTTEILTLLGAPLVAPTPAPNAPDESGGHAIFRGAIEIQDKYHQ